MTKFNNEHNKALLERCISGDKKAIDSFVNDNLGLVKSIAYRFCGRGQELEDLIQIGSIGLIKAIRGFDLSYNTEFSTYAFPLITGEIKRFLRDDGLIKISREIKKNAYTLLKAKENFINENSREPKISELCDICNLTEEQVVTALDACTPTLSLQEKINEDDNSPELLSFLSDKDFISDTVDKIALKEAVGNLNDEEKALIELRYYKGFTQSQTARILGITQVKVSRFEKKILAKLRQEFI